MKFEDKIQALRDASTSEGTEVGNYWYGLVVYWTFIDYGASKKLKATIKGEIEKCYQDLINNYHWVEKKTEVTNRYLEYKNG